MATCAMCEGRQGWWRRGRWVECDWCDGTGEVSLEEEPTAKSAEPAETDRAVGCALGVMALLLWLVAVPWVAIVRLGGGV